jgi:hypothetical protein
LKGSGMVERQIHQALAVAIRPGAWNSLHAVGVGTCCVERI